MFAPMKYFLTLLLFPLVCRAQSIDQSTPNWIVKINVPQAMDFFTFPTIMVGAERHVGNDFSLLAEGGYQLYSFQVADSVFAKPTGFKLNLELRKYLIRVRRAHPENLEGFYFGVGPYYRRNNVNKSLRYDARDAQTFQQFRDDFGVIRKYFGFHTIFGFQINFFSRIYFDWYARIGVINMEITNTNREYDPRIHRMRRRGTFGSYPKENLSEGSGINASVGLGFRVGMRL
jgi:hypothetical protein